MSMKEIHSSLIEIKSYKLIGLYNTRLIVNANIVNDQYKLACFIDSKKTDIDLTILPDLHDIIASIKVPSKSKSIKLVAVSSKTTRTILEIKNNISTRLFNSLKEIVSFPLIKIRTFMRLVLRGFKIAWTKYHFIIPFHLWKKYLVAFLSKMHNDVILFYNPYYINDYNKWLLENTCETKYQVLKYNPVISILLPVYNPDIKYLKECLDSILGQSYLNFELCIVDDKSSLEVTNVLKEYVHKDNRIKVKYRNINGGISASTNDALALSTGDFVSFMDDDDVLDKDALYKIVEVLNGNKKIDVIYTDEDKIDLKGRFCEPHFKPDYSPDTILSLNYISHFLVVRKSIVDKVGKFRSIYDGAQDYDMILRIVETTTNIYHLSSILYHWRMSSSSTSLSFDNKSNIMDITKSVLEDMVKRRGLDACIINEPVTGQHILKYNLITHPLVSVIIPTRDLASTLNKCLVSLYKSTYDNYEVIVVNNNSEEPETYELFDRYKKKYNNFRVIDYKEEFNYSAINNLAVKKCTGEYVLLLNNDTEVVTQTFIEDMLGYAKEPHIGAVGVKLYYPDKTVQHAGVVLGVGGVAVNSYIGFPHDDTGFAARLKVPYNYSAVTGAVMIVKKSKYIEVHGLTEELKVAYNDIDFCLKLIKKGYYNVVLNNVELVHYESKTRGQGHSERYMGEIKYMNDNWKDYLNYDNMYNSNFSKIGVYMLDIKKK